MSHRIGRICLAAFIAAAFFLSLLAVAGPTQASAIPPFSLSRPSDFTLTTGDGLALSISADGQALSLTMDGEALPLTPGPMLWLRDMSNAGQVTAPNLLANPGFEAGASAWSTSSEVGTEIAFTDSVSHNGAWSLQMSGVFTNGLGTGAVTSTPIPITAGQRYRISGYFLSSQGYVQGVSGTPPARQDQMWRGRMRPNGLYVRWLDQANHPVGDLVFAAPVHWDAHDWRKISGELRAPPDAAKMQIVVGGRLQDEMLWIDDLAVVASPEVEQAIGGVVVAQGDALVQTATLANGLMLTATYTAEADHIGIYIDVEDTLGEVRALEVVWGLPLSLGQSQRGGYSDMAGLEDSWRWWDDVRHSRPIDTNSAIAEPPPQYPLPPSLSWAYEHVVSGVWDGWLPVSLYPYALVEDGDHGLALASALDAPRLVKLAYDQELERYEARGYLGMSPQASKVGGHADLRLELYRTDPTWGFRSAIARFGERHASWFSSPRAPYGYAGYERGFYGSTEGAQQVLDYDQQDIFAAQYIVADAPLDISPSSDPMPSYDDTLDFVQSQIDSPSPLAHARGQAITQSVAYNANDDWQIKHIGEFEWAMGQWQAVWHTSVDPDISEGWGQFQWGWEISRAISETEAIGAVLDGIMMDNFMTAPGVDLRPDHLALTDTPLTYNVATYRPGVYNAANIHEYLGWLRQQLAGRGRADMAFTINFWGIATPNALAPYIDAFGSEGRSKTGPERNWNPRILNYRRAIAYHKPRSFSNGDNELTLQDVEEFVDLALLYAVYPQKKDDAHGWEEGSDELMAHTQQVVQQYGASGWEPVPHARTDNADVWVERYGGGEMDGGMQGDGDIHFAVHNTLTHARSSTLTVDLAPLGISDPAGLTVTELVSGSPASFQVIAEQVLIAANLTPLDTLVFRLRQEPTLQYFPFVTIQASNTSDILLDWNHDPAYSGYQIWRENNPYFAATPPAYAQVSSAPWQFSDLDALGDVEQNYYYLVSGELVGGGSVFSERLGELDFTLVPGTG